MHLAQFNAARIRAPKGSPVVAEFIAALGPINELAERSPGFVWRYVGGPAPDDLTEHDYGDDLVLNFSVWTGRDALWNYVYRTLHLDYLRRRREWFHHMKGATAVMWWIEEGHRPALADGWDRLQRLRAHGAGPDGFTFKEFHDEDGRRA